MASEEDSSSSFTCKGTPVSELRVIDIKRELDKRGLSKSGSKTQLTERLKGQLLLEKLQQDAAQSSGDELEGKAPNMALQDDKAGQNEFVRQYLQQQQRNIEIQMEVKKQVEEERKRKSADESSADESNRKKDASEAPAEPDVTSPKKFKDEQPNAPVKEVVVRMPRASRKSSRHAAKGENGQGEARTKDHSRSSTPENESIRERTRSGSSSSDHSSTREKSRRGRRGHQPRGRFSRGARRSGRAVKDSRSSSPSSSPEEVQPKRKRRSTNSVSSRSPSHSPQLAPEVGTRKSNRKTAVPSISDQAPGEVDAEDEKVKARPQRKRWSRKSSGPEQPAEKADGKTVQVLQASDDPSSTVASQAEKVEVATEESTEQQNEKRSVTKEDTEKNEKGDEVKGESSEKQNEEDNETKGESTEKQASVKIAEDNSGLKIISSPRDKLELGAAETKLSESAAMEKIQKENQDKAENVIDIPAPKVDDLPKVTADGTRPVLELSQPQQSEGKDLSGAKEGRKSEVKVAATITNENTKESTARTESTNQETKAPTNRLSRWKSSRNKSHTPPQNDESRAEDKMASEVVKSADGSDQSTSRAASEKTDIVQEDTTASLSVESGDAPSKSDEGTEPCQGEEGLTERDCPETKEKVDDSKERASETFTSSSPLKDEEKDRRSRARQSTRSGSSAGSSSRSSSSDSKSDEDSKSSSSSSRSSSSSSSNSRTNSKKAGALKKSAKPDATSQPPSDEQQRTRPKDVQTGDRKEKDNTSSKSAPEPALPAKVREKSSARKTGSEDAGGDRQNKSTATDVTDVTDGTKDSPIQTPDVDDVSKKDKLAKKRKWGSKTSKAARVVKKPANMEISSDSLKGLIGDVKLTETVFDMETEVVNTLDYDEQDDDRRDIKVKRTVVQSSPHKDEEEEEHGEENEEDARLVETREDVPKEKSPSPAFVAEEPVKKIIKLSAASPKEGKKKVKEPKKVKVKKDAASVRNKEKKKKPEETEAKETVKEKIIATRRPSKPVVQQVDDPEPVLEKVTPARFPASQVLRIIGLVRPFTLNQLKELLRRTGQLEEDLFWINSIKSECLVTYKTQEEAVETRKALHGTKWPSSNPKILDVDFSTVEDVKHRQSGNTGPLPSTQRPKEESMGRQADRREEEERERRQKAREQREKEREERDKELKDKREAEKQKRREQERRTNIREWDRDKIQQMSRSRSRSKGRDEDRTSRRSRDRERERSDRKRRERSRDKDEEKKKEKKQKAEEEPPAKLLDDLFRKTKATPCVYWLPLTEEQAQQRLLQKEEREKERQKRLAAIEERNRAEQKKREAARLERQRERQRERSGDKGADRSRDRGKENSGKGRNRGRSSGSRSRSRSRSRRRR